MIRLESVSSAMDALCGRIIIEPWLKTRSTGALDAGIDRTRIAIFARFGQSVVGFVHCQN